MKLLDVYLLVVTLSISVLESSGSLVFRSYVSENGLHGTITFTKKGEEVVINTDLQPTLEYPNTVWAWYITEFPVDYSLIEDRCSGERLGKNLMTLDDLFGYLVIPDNQTSEFSSKSLTISGENGIYGKSILLQEVETNRRVCGSINIVDKSQEKVAVARFNSPVAGNIYFRWFSTNDNHSEMLVTTDLYHSHKKEKYEKYLTSTEHHWKIYVTDIFDLTDRSEVNCNILQLVFDPQNRGSGQAMGDIDVRLGKVKVSTNYNRNKFKILYRDSDLMLLPSDITGPQRRLYVVIFEKKHDDVFLACAKIRYDHPVHSRVIIQSGGIKGDVRLTQHNRFEPTFLNFNLSTARGDLETRIVFSSTVAGYKIHELPIKPAKTVGGQNENACLTTKFVYNPRKTDMGSVPPNGYGTQDQYPLGDISGKLLNRNNASVLVPGSQELNGTFWDVFLPLQGPHSIIHRSFIIYKNTQYPTTEIVAEPWICGSISLYEANFKYQQQIFTAQVVFRYPTVGRLIMRQVKDEPWTDTTVLIEYLVHADGAQLNNSAEHRWAIHESPPGKDFYDWQNRCLSAGNIYNPYKIDYDNTSNIEQCNLDSIGLCRVGDLSKRQGTLDISGKIADSDRISRKLWTDPLLPLTGPHSILGKSFVLYDDHGPKARGERLACSKIGGVYKRKAVARDWFANSGVLTVKGKIEFFQQTEYDITNVEVAFDGLQDASGYHVHVTPVEENLQFPCEETTLYGHWNPLNVDPTSSPTRYQGTTDQYEMGDLSGKFGNLENATTYKNFYNDTMLPLFGPRSILARSIIIHKKVGNKRWVCSTIERGYSPSEAREIRAIASFHHPQGYAYGYMKMKQLIYTDGSSSDTTVEVKLRYPGKNDRNITRDHNWAIYVNPVGVDAAVKTQNTRCVAGGYVWNPYFTQLADPLNDELYRQECGPENPLRCYVGDLSARLGTIDIGLKRKVFVDSNFPLEGDVTAVGRSIVILSPNRRGERYACANIEPDYDIIKYANIEKPPRFVVAQFIEDIREVMGIPEWFLTVDSRQTKTLHNNACVQILLHFKGPIASRLEQDFNRLLSIGRLESPSLYIPGYIKEKRKKKISYKLCGVRDPNEKSSRRTTFLFGSSATKSYPTLTDFTLVLSVVLSSVRYLFL
ncbi:superoxide dismutase family protein Rsod [Rhynchophorus ferrugineus]|uniref:superoxide dismutase family protein Rsod n=1 Tax=Rhynchophorus ferrugineus TaxID=354439 RepID=UPI003FCD1465